ncbi:MAG TPA: hypothetical protein VEO54_02415 [Thermoanaerobaculia bacterium]|nr:hypothetical protein [Thermoanaerobaculia bacterium]
MQGTAQTTTTWDPQNPHVGAGQLQMAGTPGDYITGNREYRVGPQHGRWFGFVTHRTDDGTPLGVRISFSSNDFNNEITGSSWFLEFHVVDIPGAVFGEGTYVGAQRAPFTDSGHPGLSVTGDGRGCNTITGRFEVTAFEFDCIPDTTTTQLHLTHFAGTFEQHCEGGRPFARGSIIYNAPSTGTICGDDGDGDGDGEGDGDDDGEDEEEPAPPPPFQVTFPSEVWTAPVEMTNSETRTIAFNTAVDGTVISDLNLSVITNALPTDEFHAEITPSVIAAPGAAEGQIKITTGPMTFPRTYTVTVIASDGTVFNNSSFLVDVQCTPPFILGIDQPRSVAATGGNVQLQTKASGSGPFTYQWYRGFRGMTRDPIATTGANLTVPNDSANYWVRVRNACGTFDSQVVRAANP